MIRLRFKCDILRFKCFSVDLGIALEAILNLTQYTPKAMAITPITEATITEVALLNALLAATLLDGLG